MRKEYYQKRKNKGICMECGARLIGKRKGKTLCTKCAEKHSKYIKENTAFFISLGLCPRCGKERVMGDEKRCPECRAKEWKQNTEYRNTHPEYREKKNANARLLRQFRIENHLCTDCGIELDDSRFKACEKCRIKRRLAAEKHRRKVKYADSRR